MRNRELPEPYHDGIKSIHRWCIEHKVNGMLMFAGTFPVFSSDDRLV
jgi:hypothetical protein